MLLLMVVRHVDADVDVDADVGVGGVVCLFPFIIYIYI
jgi:hypothetical protein